MRFIREQMTSNSMYLSCDNFAELKQIPTRRVSLLNLQFGKLHEEKFPMFSVEK